MKQIVWMAAGCIGSWLVATLLMGQARELFLGMLGPLVASTGTWMALIRAYRQDPSRVTGVLMRAFGAKMVFFSVYVLIAARVGSLDVVPFVASFAVYFIGLQVVMAAFVRGLTVPQAS